MATQVGSGDYKFERVPSWPNMPKYWEMGLASDGAVNQSKGDDDPAAWLPKQELQCDYALTWVAVKDAWSLAVDDSEASALAGMLERCPARRNDPVR